MQRRSTLSRRWRIRLGFDGPGGGGLASLSAGRRRQWASVTCRVWYGPSREVSAVPIFIAACPKHGTLRTAQPLRRTPSVVPSNLLPGSAGSDIAIPILLVCFSFISERMSQNGKLTGGDGLAGMPPALPKLRSGLWRLHHGRYFMNDVHHHVGSDREENCEQSRERTNDGEGDTGWWRDESFDSDAQRHDLLLWGRNRDSFAQEITNVARADWTASLPIVRPSAHRSYTVPDNIVETASGRGGNF